MDPKTNNKIMRELNMKISVDSREKERKNRAKDFYIAKGCDVTIKRLDYGDYLFYEDNADNSCIFEYKRIDDFMQSIKNESLFQEAANQSMKYPYHFVIIVGELKHFVTSNWNFAKKSNYAKYVHDNYARYYGALRRLRSFTTTIEVETEEQAFAEMYFQAEKCLDDRTPNYLGVTRKVKNKYNPVLTFLTCINGINVKKGNAIIDEYNINTLEDLLKLDIDDLIKIKGIGNKTAKNIMMYIK